jgi:hypothetical protein
MKYTIYEDPISHRFAHAPLPADFLEGDPLPALVTERWFESHAAAVAALSEILDREAADADAEPATAADAPESPVSPLQTGRRRIVWLQH